MRGVFFVLFFFISNFAISERTHEGVEEVARKEKVLLKSAGL